ncbi:MAG: substrate-binding domain-containing protein [Verrucomicrobia bacterium]|nr:substrate-binding domain-containing protein [Verrucomicrobiota bacterium]
MNKMIYPRLLPFVIAFSLTFPLAGHAAPEKLKIVFSVPNMAFPWAAFTTKIAQATGKKLNADVLLQDGQGSSSTQSSDLRNAVNQGVDGIVIAPTDVKALVPAVNDVIRAKIPIVTIDRYVTGTQQPVPHFGADNVAGGVEQAKFVVEHFPAGAKIIMLTGEPGSSPAIDRAAGVHQTLKAAGDKYKIVADQTANFARAQGFTVTQNILTALGNPPDAIIASNDDMALGAVKALAQAGIPKGKVMVLGFDALPEGLAAVRDGDMAATVEQLPAEQVETSMNAVVDFIRNKKPLESKKLTPVLITKHNLNQAERYNEVKM